MPYKRYVEIGRIALVNFGEEAGKLVTIVDVVDQNRALVDAADGRRHVINFKRLSITDYKIDIKRHPAMKDLKKALAEADVAGKFAKSSWGQKLAKQAKKASLTDLDRHRAMVAKAKKSRVVRKTFNSLKKAAAKAAPKKK